MSVCNIFTVLKVYCKTYHNNKIQVHVSQKLAFQKFDILKFQKFDNDYLFAFFNVQALSAVANCQQRKMRRENTLNKMNEDL